MALGYFYQLKLIDARSATASLKMFKKCHKHFSLKSQQVELDLPLAPIRSIYLSCRSCYRKKIMSNNVQIMSKYCLCYIFFSIFFHSEEKSSTNFRKKMSINDTLRLQLCCNNRLQFFSSIFINKCKIIKK